ncbi:MAG TPA: sulfotransferase, partial [Pilimelia sp.]|nr:sulfotransferase [Pilimelia sp.]
GHRCGSTLIQRLLSSHPDVMIWGEQEGQLGPLLRLGAHLRECSDGLGKRARDKFAEGGYQTFMANLLPGTGDVDDALRAFVRRLFAEPALARGRQVWGFKEVRYDRSEAEELHRLFPGLAIVFVIRNPRDILRSIDHWQQLGGWDLSAFAEDAISHWRRVADSFLSADPVGLPVLTFRYEDLVIDTATAAARIAAHTGLDLKLFDMDVFERQVPGGPPRNGLVPRPWHELPAARQALLADDESRRIAAAWGYAI